MISQRAPTIIIIETKQDRMSGLWRKTARSRHHLLSHVVSFALGVLLTNLLRSNMCATTSSLKQIPAVLGQGELEDPSPANDGKSQPRPSAVPPYTVVITAHPIPSHPSLEHIERTMDSLELLNPKPAHVILACDYPQKLHEKYRQFKEAFRVRYPHVEIVAKDSPWEGICGNVKSGFGAAKTEFILTVQVTIALDVLSSACSCI